jgi:DNA-binding NarL/FixJ family response regulator
VRVVLADDHPMYRFGLAAVLAQAEDIDVVAVAGSLEELLSAVESGKPDVVLTDLSMPGVTGAEVVRRLRAARPDVPVLALTMHEDDEHVFAALRAGAAGYLVKGADGSEIVGALRTVVAGGAVYGGSVARRVRAHFAGDEGVSSTARAFPMLTPRERDVLDLVALGRRNHEIAQRLGLSDKTVRNHVSAILLKLQVTDRTGAALRAREAKGE